MNCEWIAKPIWKHPIQKIEETVEPEVKLPHLNRKPLVKKQIFVQTPFFQSTLKVEQKNSCQKSTHFLFRCDQNHYSNLTSKSWKRGSKS